MQNLQAADVPSALDELDRLRTVIAGRRPAFFLDYDGTLTPIVERPELALLPAATREVLRRLAARYPTLVVSGRGREDVERLVDLPGIACAGSHGFDIAGPLRFAPAAAAEPVVAAITRELEAELARVPGAQVEPKRFTVAVHYRRVDPDRVREVERVVDRLLAAHPGLRKTGGKMVWELRPDLDWDKGRAVVWILGALGLDRPDVVPVYLGDDVTDEDAFRVLRERPGDGGLGILVAEEPRETAASFRLRDPEEVRRFLADFAEQPV
ncbi:MAG TPA: trehalose-phosphatase [Thermoanaerobaculia bacterium]|nr:trehalose-phosphatase [Thermoanaerobaculia bacterium]